MSLKKDEARARRKKRIRKKVLGTAERPRFTVFRSLKHIYAQLVDDLTGKTIVSVSSALKDFTGSGGNVDGAKKVGSLLGEKAVQSGIKKVVFDRNGYLYHGRVRALAEAAREKGLSF
jgi:large subunit ribosomal protein L18